MGKRALHFARCSFIARISDRGDFTGKQASGGHGCDPCCAGSWSATATGILGSLEKRLNPVAGLPTVNKINGLRWIQFRIEYLTGFSVINPFFSLI